MRMRSTKFSLALGAALLLAACGGGAQFGGGISGSGKPGIKLGGVDTGGGDVSIAGTTFDVAMAVVTIDGAAATKDDLRQGHIALVEGFIDGALGVADTITVEAIVKGVLESKLDEHRLMVQGQKVAITENTVFGAGIAPASPDGLVIDDLLKIYGFVRAPGAVLATRIERVSVLTEIRVVGVAQNVDPGQKRFAIGQQPIDHRTADVSQLPGGDPANGQLVGVRGGTNLGPVGEVVATKVEPLGLANQPDNDASEVEGIVTAILSLTEFKVGAVRVRTDDETRFFGGHPEDVVLGARVDIEGALQGGVLLARKVKFGATVEIEADVDRVAGSTLSLVGLPGVTVTISSLTQFNGNATELADIQAGDHIKLRGRKTGSSSVAAVRVIETGADTDVVFQGPVDPSPTPMNPLVSVLGVLINTSGMDNDEFESPENEVIGRAAFFAALRPGLLVKFQGELVGEDVVWDEAEIEGGE